MRHGRAKAARRALKFYALNSSHKIRPPYSVLCDGNFLAAAARQNVPLRDRLGKTLQGGEFRLFVCRSALDELGALAEAHRGEEAGATFEEARRFGLDECEIIGGDGVPGGTRGEDGGGGGGGESTSGLGRPGEDVLHLVSAPDPGGGGGRGGGAAAAPTPNERGYLVGTQDESLSDALRGLPLVPQLRLTRGVLLLESPSAASRRYAAGLERRRELSGGGSMSEGERRAAAAVRDEERRRRAEERGREAAEELRRAGMVRRKRKARGPNPLSCKRRKGGGEGPGRGTGGESPVEKKKRRRRKRGATSEGDRAEIDK